MRISIASQHLFGFTRRLARDESGAALIYVSIALTVFMGFAALVIDGGRLFTLDTELQSAADAIALAGAAELDGNADAQTRAVAAMNNLVQNSQTFGTGAAAVTSYTPRFLDELPADDQPITADFVTADAAEMRFVEVTVNEREVDSMFATAIGGDETAGADAVAVAGFTSAVCKFTPLFMCNPYEAAGVDTLTELTAKVEDPEEQRRIIALKAPGGSDPYGPGNFGFLQPGDDDTKFKDSLAMVNPGTCFNRDGVDTHTGNIDSARFALNTRFDLWDSSFNSKKNDPDYRPAPNVTKGYLPEVNAQGKVTANGYCNPTFDSTYAQAYSLPIDSSIDSTNRMGNGNWDYARYWDMNHGNRNGNYTDDPPPAGKNWDNTDSNRPSRYEVYSWETAVDPVTNETNTPDNSGATPIGENGIPQCSKSDPGDDPDRRIIYAAVVNCGEHPVSGHDTGIPAVAFVKMFMTQPMYKAPATGQEATDNTLYVEMVGVVQPGTDDEVVHDIVQLYR